MADFSSAKTKIGKREKNSTSTSIAGKPSEVDIAPSRIVFEYGEFWEYVSAKDLDGQKMVWGAVEGMVKSFGDP